MDLEKLLSGGDLRSVEKCDSLSLKIKNQKDFDGLFKFLFHPDRIVVMHAADVIEKITRDHPQYLAKYKKEMMDLFYAARNKELKWHLAVLIPRLNLDSSDFGKVWNTLTNWAKDKKGDSKLVRVGAVQGLYEMTKKKMDLLKDFNLTMLEVEKENIASVNARIRNIRKEMGKEMLV